MKTLEVYRQGERTYEHVCAFARDVYREDLSFDLTHFPETLFALTEEERVQGCIGLNTEIHFPLFLNDPLVGKEMTKFRSKRFGEQSILAVRGCLVGLPVLIANAAAYGHLLGLHKILYAAIPVSQKTIENLGLTAKVFGPAELRYFPESERHLYARWHALGPMSCVLDTKNALGVFERVLHRFSRRLELGPALQDLLVYEMAKAA